MIESTARASRYDVADTASPAYLWEVAGKPVSVRIPYAVIDRMEHEAVESFRSLSSRGSEIGGLLFGFTQPGSPAAVTVEDYAPIPCDYSRGPLYRLSDADLARFAEAMAGNGHVVGFFRSHTRKGLSLDSDDLALMDGKFREPHHVALLIRPFATKPSTAGIFIREDGGIRGDASYLEFPFRSAALSGTTGNPAAESDRVPAPSRTLPPPIAPKPATRAQIVPIASRREIVPPVAPPTAEPAAQPELSQTELPKPETAKPETVKPEAAPPQPPEAAAAKPEPEPAKPEVAERAEPAEATSEPQKAKNSKLVWLVLGALVPALLAVVLFVYPGLLHRGRSTPAVDSSPLALRVERSAGELLLTWNRDSAAIKTATQATLSISDGDQHENVQMDLGQLRNGSIVYSPVTSDVTFRMEVTGRDRTKTTSESVRVLRTRPSPMPDQPQTAAAGAPPAAAARHNSENTAATPDGEPAADSENTAPTHLAEPLKPFNAESLAQRLRPTRPTDIPAAPEVNGAPQVTVSGLNLNAVAPLPAPPRPAAPAPANQPAPAADPTAPKKVAPGGQIQQAQLIYRKNPDYPRLAQDSGIKGAVELIATIGADGHIRNLKVVRGHPLLQRAAIDAVRQWVYKPTLLNGQPVESQTQIILNFTNER